jgi:hypothetical protein
MAVPARPFPAAAMALQGGTLGDGEKTAVFPKFVDASLLQSLGYDVSDPRLWGDGVTPK